MEISPERPTGLWLPLVTPFREGDLDETSLRRLVRHYANEPIDGLILAATTGEGLTLDEEESERLVHIVASECVSFGRRSPLYLGLSGADTRKLGKMLAATQSWPVDGYLIACPYYSRPSQLGLFRHFTALSQSTSRRVMVYNIPYRTGVNLANETMLRLAELSNIVGVKDCCADATQSFDLLRRSPDGFAVLTGEDALFYSALTLGADGGVVASAHVRTGAFAAVFNKMVNGDQLGALQDWRKLADIPRLLFSEPSPAPIKYWLWRAGLIESPEVRLPMTPISNELAARIDREITRGVIEPAPLETSS
jgi:4-hydroxy-tetrahydrodipicolinate synthase